MTAVPVLALLIDRAVGEPPACAHPVVWMGRLLDALAARRRVGAPPSADVAIGAAAVGTAGALVAALAGAVSRACWRLPAPAGAAVEAVALSTLLSDRLLRDEVLATEAALARGIGPARRQLARLVSRDTADLEAADVRAAALESLAENASDSIVAPLWWYAVAGLRGAAVYRLVNTADAMWGYRTAPWTWWGRAAARADDLANWVPARLTGVALAPRGGGLRRLARVAAVTPSPNAGWPMGATALRRDVRLAKAGVYVLHPAGRPPRAADVHEVVGAVARTAAIAAVAAGLAARRSRS